MNERHTTTCTFAFPSSEYILPLIILHFYAFLNVYLGGLSHSEPDTFLLAVLVSQLPALISLYIAYQYLQGNLRSESLYKE